MLDRRCGRCHSGDKPAGKVDLSGDKTGYFNVSYEVIVRDRRGNASDNNALL